MRSEPRIYGLVPAAGRSRRMGRDKALCRLGGRTFLERILDAIGELEVLVVLRPDQEEVLGLLGRAGPRARVVFNRLGESHMVDSVALGVQALDRLAPGWSGVLVWPVDVPLVGREVVSALLETAAWDPSRAVLPNWQGRTGHPVYVPRQALVPLLEGKPPFPFSLRDLLAAAPRAHVAAGPEVVQNLNDEVAAGEAARLAGLASRKGRGQG